MALLLAAVASLGFCFLLINCAGSSSGPAEVLEKIPGMAAIPSGCFEMGDTGSKGDPDEDHLHQICLNGFLMDTCEVTQSEYEKVTGNNPSHFKDCPQCPVERVTWQEASTYCKKVGKRLPTEAEWEYAGKAGSKVDYHWGSYLEVRLKNKDNEWKVNPHYAWYWNNADNKTHPVGSKKPNKWGLYDMSGNVWEWVDDWYDGGYYYSSPKNNPKGPSSGKGRVLRGGSWADIPKFHRNSQRRWNFPLSRSGSDGFRCAH